jgi:hypothetical protein
MRVARVSRIFSDGRFIWQSNRIQNTLKYTSLKENTAYR